MHRYFNFGIYTSDPITGTTGWNIQMVSVKAETKEDARIKLKKYPDFDVIILFNYQHDENETHDFLVTQNYPEFQIIDRLNQKQHEDIKVF